MGEVRDLEREAELASRMLRRVRSRPERRRLVAAYCLLASRRVEQVAGAGGQLSVERVDVDQLVVCDSTQGLLEAVLGGFWDLCWKMSAILGDVYI